jgi:steroid delta-isomerase
MSEPESRAHIARFNAAVRSGDWTQFLAGFAPDAVMTFDGPPVGPFIGRDAIAAGYAADPPDDTMEILAVRADGDADLITFRWTSGGTGTITLRRHQTLITHLAVTFD